MLARDPVARDLERDGARSLVKHQRKFARKEAIAAERQRRASHQMQSAVAIQIADINAMNMKSRKTDRDVANRLTDQFRAANEKKPRAHAQRIIEVVRIIVDEHTRRLGASSYEAAASAAQQIEALSAHHIVEAAQQPNRKRAAIAEKKARDKFEIWEESVAGLLPEMSLADRVERYIQMKKGSLGRHDRARIRALARAGKLK